MKLKSNLELDDSFAEAIERRYNAVRTYLENNHSDFVRSQLIGSLQRKTRKIPGQTKEFDVDILVVIGTAYNWVTTGGITPEAAMGALHETMTDSDRYVEMNPVQDAPTVTLTGSEGDIEIKVELVPALADNIGHDQLGNYLGSIGRGYWVVKGGRWQMADYDYEAEYISARNALSEEFLIPSIKMLKSIRDHHFSEMSSFPLEIVAASIIPLSVILKRTQNTPIRYRDLLAEFFDQAPAHLATSLRVPQSKSGSILLGDTSAQSLTNTFGTIARFIRAIDDLPQQEKQVELWRQLFGDYFPTRV